MKYIPKQNRIQSKLNSKMAYNKNKRTLIMINLILYLLSKVYTT